MTDNAQQSKKSRKGYSPLQASLEHLQKLQANIVGEPYEYSATEESRKGKNINFTRVITQCQNIQQNLQKNDHNQSTMEVEESKQLSQSQNSSFRTPNCLWEKQKQTRIVKVNMAGSAAMNNEEVSILSDFFDKDEIAVIMTSVVRTGDLANFQFEAMVSKLMTSTTDSMRVYK